MLVKEDEELLLQRLSGSTFRKREVFIVGELAEVLREDVLEVVKHLVQGRDLCRVHYFVLLLLLLFLSFGLVFSWSDLFLLLLLSLFFLFAAFFILTLFFRGCFLGSFSIEFFDLCLFPLDNAKLVLQVFPELILD